MKKLDDYLPRFDACRLSEPSFCRAICPFHLDVVDFVDKVGKGAYSAAYRTYRDAVCFPRVVSEICPAPCNDVCPLGRAPFADLAFADAAGGGAPFAALASSDASDGGTGGGGSVDLPMLERYVASAAGIIPPNDYNIPVRSGRIGIIGAGLSGLGCALRLATRKYHVEIFEKADRIGGADLDRLGTEAMDACLRDIESQFSNEDCEIHLNHEITYVDDLIGAGFDTVYIATGSGGADFGATGGFGKDVADFCANGGLNCSEHCVVAGGALTGELGVHALAAGLRMAVAIDGWFKTGKFVCPEDEYETCAVLHPLTLEVMAQREQAVAPDKMKDSAETIPHKADVNNDVTIREPVVREAERCIRCKCNACELFCDLISYTGKQPPRIREEIFATTLPGASEVKHLPAKRLMHLCTQCGVCKEVCPENIDIGGLILAGRQQMHRYGKAPWAFHEFFLNDMDHADGDAAGFAYMPDTISARYAFFPGCQIGAGDPNLVARVYEAIKEIDSGVGIFVRCCGAPAEWAGENERHEGKLADIRANWEALGRPTLLMACPTCIREFNEYMPEIPATSVYEWLAQEGASMMCQVIHLTDTRSPDTPTDTLDVESTDAGGRWAIFDPCSARNDEGMKNAVRSLAHRAELYTKELPIQSEVARCCGYGGQPPLADPAFAAYVAKDRASESELPYITYCYNCRDVFMKEGKAAKHIFELLFPHTANDDNDDDSNDNKADASHDFVLPTATDRRRNREYLKMILSGTDTSEIPSNGSKLYPNARYDFTLAIPDNLQKKMDEQKILEDDAYAIVDFMRRTGRSVYNQSKGTHSGYRKIGHMTYWAEYKDDAGLMCQVIRPPDTLMLVNIYAHRMSIEVEQVWNGHKIREEFLSE